MQYPVVAAWAVVMTMCSGCFFIAPPVQFGGKTSKEAQHQTLTHQTPPALIAADSWSGAVTTQRIRVYADDDFRAQNVHWQRTFDDELAYANEVLAPLLGVKLVADYRTWDHHAPGASLAEGLAELQRIDAGDGVLTVVGLTSSIALVTGTFDQLGYATIGGRHLIVRGYADREERQMFERAFPDLSAEERASLFAARRRHKTTAILLHELGHNLGVNHESEATTLMNASYSPQSASFSSHSRDVMLATLAERLHRGGAGASPQAAVAHGHPRLVVKVDAQERAVIGGQAVDDATAGELFHMSYEDDHDTEVVISIARTAPRAAAIRLIDVAKAAGIVRVALQLEDPP